MRLVKTASTPLEVGLLTLTQLTGAPTNYRFEPLKDCFRYEPRDWRSYGHAFNLLVKLSVKLELVYEAMI